MLEAAVVVKPETLVRWHRGGFRLNWRWKSRRGVGRPAVVLFDWQTGQRRQVLRPQTNFQGTAWGVGFHPSGFIAAAGGGSGGALWFWRPDQSASFHTAALPNNARDLHLHPDGHRIAIPFFDSVLRIYEI